MDVIGLGPLRAGSLEWKPRTGARALTVVCKATYRLSPGEAELADPQEYLNEVDDHWNDDPTRSLYATSDLVPRKARADVLLVGHAFSPRGEPVRQLVVRLAVGSVDKEIEVLAERAWTREGALRDGTRFSRMPLRYERAAGGPGTWNPVGVRTGAAAAPDAAGQIALPNLQAVGATPATPGAALEPVGLGPLPASWPLRRDRLGYVEPAWIEDGFGDVTLSDDFDFGYFNAAPRDQQLAQIRDNERIILQNLSREQPRLITTLPGQRPRAFAERPGAPPREIPMRADTLWIDTDRGICTLAWRGELALEAGTEPGRVLIAPERGAERLTYEEVVRLAVAAGQPEAPPAPTAATPAPSSTAPSPSPLAMGTPPPLVMSSDVAPMRPALLGQALGQAPPPPASIAQAPPSIVMPPAPIVMPPAPIVMPPAPIVMPPAPIGTPSEPANARPAPVFIQARPDRETTEFHVRTAKVEVFRPSQALPFQPAPPTGSPIAVSDAPPPEKRDRRALSRTLTTVEAPSVSMGGAPSWLAPRAAPPQAPPPPTGKPPPPPLRPGAPAAAPSRPASGPPPLPAIRARIPSVPIAFTLPGTVDLLWVDPTASERVRAAWRELLPEPGTAAADAIRVLATARPAETGALEELLGEATGADPRFQAPLVAVTGELRFLFDEIESLRASAVAIALLAAGDERLRDAAAAAGEVLRIPTLEHAGAVAEPVARRLRETFAHLGRALPGGQLDAAIERGLLERRCYQRRTVLGGPRLRALLITAGAAPIPVYLPEAAVAALPLFSSLPVRLLAAVHPPQEQQEAPAVALDLLAIGRVLGRPRAE